MALSDYKKLPAKDKNEKPGEVTPAWAILTKKYGVDMFGAGQCENCRHYTGTIYCKAFPGEDGIPVDILTDQFIHVRKHPEQENEILFERKE